MGSADDFNRRFVMQRISTSRMKLPCSSRQEQEGAGTHITKGPVGEHSQSHYRSHKVHR